MADSGGDGNEVSPSGQAIKGWLDTIGLQEYFPVFDVFFTSLGDVALLTDEDLDSMAVYEPAHRLLLAEKAAEIDGHWDGVADELAIFARRPDNQLCADCNAFAPTWAAKNIGALVCSECCGVHRSLGVHISQMQSLTIDDWLPEEIAFMLTKGNAIVNAVYEAEIPVGYEKPTSRTDRAVRAFFITYKYSNMFVAGNETAARSSTDPLPEEFEAVRQQAEAASGTTAMQHYIGTLTVRLIKGTNLIAQDINGKSDPYVVFWTEDEAGVREQQIKSGVRKKTLNPEWNETFVFCVKHVGQRLCLECFDWDKFTKDDPMGLGVVEITAALTEETPVTVTLTDVKRGSINLALTLTMLADDEG